MVKIKLTPDERKAMIKRLCILAQLPPYVENQNYHPITLWVAALISVVIFFGPFIVCLIVYHTSRICPTCGKKGGTIDESCECWECRSNSLEIKDPEKKHITERWK